MLIESCILLKYHFSCNFMLKNYITISLGQFTKTLNQFFYLSRANEKFESCMPVLLDQLNELKQFRGTFIE